VSDIWEKIATCTNCTDEAPCAEHEAEAMELYEAQVVTPTWEELMRVVFMVAQMSPDPSTQNAAFLVHPDKARTLVQPSIAVNEFPRGVKVTDERWVRPHKYVYVEHAERNSIFATARAGVSTNDMTMVTLWASCADCARAIIQSGITTVVRYHMPIGDSWLESCAIGDTMLQEAGVETITIEASLDGVKPIRRNETMWSPSNT